MWVDSDYGGCKTTRKSTSGGVVLLGGHMIKSWSTNQAVIALSSGEAEYYAMLQGASAALGVACLAGERGIGLEVELRSDSSAGLGWPREEG